MSLYHTTNLPKNYPFKYGAWRSVILGLPMINVEMVHVRTVEGKIYHDVYLNRAGEWVSAIKGEIKNVEYWKPRPEDIAARKAHRAR